jgi:hypothetical protein
VRVPAGLCVCVRLRAVVRGRVGVCVCTCVCTLAGACRCACGARALACMCGGPRVRVCVRVRACVFVRASACVRASVCVCARARAYSVARWFLKSLRSYCEPWKPCTNTNRCVPACSTHTHYNAHAHARTHMRTSRAHTHSAYPNGSAQGYRELGVLSAYYPYLGVLPVPEYYAYLGVLGYDRGCWLRCVPRVLPYHGHYGTAWVL